MQRFISLVFIVMLLSINHVVSLDVGRSFAQKGQYISPRSFDSPVEAYGERLVSSFPIELPMRGEMNLFTSSSAHLQTPTRDKCPNRNMNSGGTQDCYALDFVGITNKNIHPIASGEVIFAGEIKCCGYEPYGKIIYIKHNDDYASLYAHLNSINVIVGQKVNISDVIGTEGRTGGMTWDHLHLAIYKKAKTSGNNTSFRFSGGHSVAVGYESGNPTFQTCHIVVNPNNNSNTKESCSRLYRHRTPVNNGLPLRIKYESISQSVVPSLQSPDNGHTTTDGLWPTLSWNSTSNGPFEIRVSRNPNFSDCVVCENVSGKSYRPSGSGADAWMRARTGTFYWRVRVAGGTWSSGRSFRNTLVRTPTPTPVIPNGLSPTIDYTTTDGLWPTLSWQSISNGPFEIWISSKNDFSNQVVFETVSGKSYRPTSDAWMRARTGTFYWSVRVVGGEWAPGFWFHNTIVRTPTRTPTPVSVVPSLQSPANGHTTTDGLWPTLSWNSTSNGPFEIRVSKNPNFSDCVVCENVSGKSYRPSGSGADGWMRSHIGTLYWRVRVVGGTWSSGRSFQNTIDITHTPSPTRSRTPAPHTPTWTPTLPPPTWTSSPTASPRPPDAELTMPILRSPVDGATDVGTRAELDWEDVTRGNVNRYEVEVCIETSRGSNNWNCDKYDTNGAESRWKVWDRTGKIFPQRKIRWRVNANDGTKDGPVSEWRYFQPRYTYPTGYTVSGDTLKLSVSRESNDVTYQCKYNFGGFSGSSWSSVDKTSFSGNSCSFSISSMRSKGANRGRTVYWIITSDSKKTLGDFDGRENTDSKQWSFSMP